MTSKKSIYDETIFDLFDALIHITLLVINHSHGDRRCRSTFRHWASNSCPPCANIPQVAAFVFAAAWAVQVRQTNPESRHLRVALDRGRIACGVRITLTGAPP